MPFYANISDWYSTSEESKQIKDIKNIFISLLLSSQIKCSGLYLFFCTFFFFVELFLALNCVCKCIAGTSSVRRENYMFVNIEYPSLSFYSFESIWFVQLWNRAKRSLNSPKCKTFSVVNS